MLMNNASGKLLLVLFLTATTLLMGCAGISFTEENICGNYICEDGENGINCPNDCVSTEPNNDDKIQQLYSAAEDMNISKEIVDEQIITNGQLPKIMCNHNPPIGDVGGTFTEINGETIITGDGYVTSLDALITQSVFLKLIQIYDKDGDGKTWNPDTSTIEDYGDAGCMDFNDDGYATSLDALMIQTAFLGLPSMPKAGAPNLPGNCNNYNMYSNPFEEEYHRVIGDISGDEITDETDITIINEIINGQKPAPKNHDYGCIDLAEPYGQITQEDINAIRDHPNFNSTQNLERYTKTNNLTIQNQQGNQITFEATCPYTQCLLNYGNNNTETITQGTQTKTHDYSIQGQHIATLEWPTGQETHANIGEVELEVDLGIKTIANMTYEEFISEYNIDESDQPPIANITSKTRVKVIPRDPQVGVSRLFLHSSKTNSSNTDMSGKSPFDIYMNGTCGSGKYCQIEIGVVNDPDDESTWHTLLLTKKEPSSGSEFVFNKLRYTFTRPKQYYVRYIEYSNPGSPGNTTEQYIITVQPKIVDEDVSDFWVTNKEFMLMLASMHDPIPPGARERHWLVVPEIYAKCESGKRCKIEFRADKHGRGDGIAESAVFQGEQYLTTPYIIPTGFDEIPLNGYEPENEASIYLLETDDPDSEPDLIVEKIVDMHADIGEYTDHANTWGDYENKWFYFAKKPYGQGIIESESYLPEDRAIIAQCPENKVCRLVFDDSFSGYFLNPPPRKPDFYTLPFEGRYKPNTNFQPHSFYYSMGYGYHIVGMQIYADMQDALDFEPERGVGPIYDPQDNDYTGSIMAVKFRPERHGFKNRSFQVTDTFRAHPIVEENNPIQLINTCNVNSQGCEITYTINGGEPNESAFDENSFFTKIPPVIDYTYQTIIPQQTGDYEITITEITNDAPNYIKCEVGSFVGDVDGDNALTDADSAIIAATATGLLGINDIDKDLATANIYDLCTNDNCTERKKAKIIRDYADAGCYDVTGDGYISMDDAILVQEMLEEVSEGNQIQLSGISPNFINNPFESEVWKCTPYANNIHDLDAQDNMRKVGDLTGDQQVSSEDYYMLENMSGQGTLFPYWNKTKEELQSTGDWIDACCYDINDDEEIDNEDLRLLRETITGNPQFPRERCQKPQTHYLINNLLQENNPGNSLTNYEFDAECPPGKYCYLNFGDAHFSDAFQGTRTINHTYNSGLKYVASLELVLDGNSYEGHAIENGLLATKPRLGITQITENQGTGTHSFRVECPQEEQCYIDFGDGTKSETFSGNTTIDHQMRGSTSPYDALLLTVTDKMKTVSQFPLRQKPNLITLDRAEISTKCNEGELIVKNSQGEDECKEPGIEFYCPEGFKKTSEDYLCEYDGKDDAYFTLKGITTPNEKTFSINTESDFTREFFALTGGKYAQSFYSQAPNENISITFEIWTGSEIGVEGGCTGYHECKTALVRKVEELANQETTMELVENRALNSNYSEGIPGLDYENGHLLTTTITTTEDNATITFTRKLQIIEYENQQNRQDMLIIYIDVLENGSYPQGNGPLYTRVSNILEETFTVNN